MRSGTREIVGTGFSRQRSRSQPQSHAEQQALLWGQVLAGPGPGGAGGVAPITFSEATAVEAGALRKCKKFTNLSCVKVSNYERTSGTAGPPLPDNEFWALRHPTWFQQFRAGELFACPKV
jgi:hypothetical protein